MQNEKLENSVSIPDKLYLMLSCPVFLFCSTLHLFSKDKPQVPINDNIIRQDLLWMNI